MNADFLAFAFGQIHQFGGGGQAERVFEQRTDAAAQRTAGDVGQAEGVLDDRIIGAADFERALAGADVQAGFAVQVARQNQLAHQL